MTKNGAQKFVERMQSDKSFRQKMSSQTNIENLQTELTESGFAFQLTDLVKAMACCMDSMEQNCETKETV